MRYNDFLFWQWVIVAQNSYFYVLYNEATSVQGRRTSTVHMNSKLPTSANTMYQTNMTLMLPFYHSIVEHEVIWNIDALQWIIIEM